MILIYPSPPCTLEAVFTENRIFLPYLKLTQSFENDVWKMTFLLGWNLFRCYVGFREGTIANCVKEWFVVSWWRDIKSVMETKIPTKNVFLVKEHDHVTRIIVCWQFLAQSRCRYDDSMGKGHNVGSCNQSCMFNMSFFLLFPQEISPPTGKPWCRVKKSDDQNHGLSVS